MYFFDWVLKFGYLIEAYLKECLIFQLRINCILHNFNYNKILGKRKTIGRILRKLKGDKTIAHYRNSIFHADFLLDYKVNFDERKVVFKGESGRKRELKINKFVSTFFSCYQVVYTYLLAIPYFFLKVNKDQIIQNLKHTAEKMKAQLESYNFEKNAVSDEEKENIKQQLAKELKRSLGLYD